jgi:hypothetical protein
MRSSGKTVFLASSTTMNGAPSLCPRKVSAPNTNNHVNPPQTNQNGDEHAQHKKMVRQLYCLPSIRGMVTSVHPETRYFALNRGALANVTAGI